MGSYIFKDAAGNKYRVETKEGVSESAAFEQFNAAMKAQPKAAGVSAEAARMATEGMGPLESVAANLGAGIDTTWQGLKQLVGAGPGDAALEEQRRMKDALAESTTGGGALQFGGEVLPTLAIPGGGFVKAGQVGVKGASALARMLAGAGSGAAGAARLATPARIGTGVAALDAALAGGVSGALQPTTEDESRAFNVGLGTVGGAVLPGVVAGGRKVANYVTQGGAQERAAAQLIAALGGEDAARAAAAEVRGYRPGAYVSDVPMSTGEILQNPRIAGLERTARTRFKEDWSNLTAAQAEARYNALRDATSGADDLTRLVERRDVVTGPLREQALTAAQKDLWFHSPVGKKLMDVMGSDSWANPDVKDVVKYVKGVLDDGVTPGRLYEAKKYLDKQLHGPTTLGISQLSSAAKNANRVTLEVMNSIDDALNQATKGKWQKYLDRYQQESGGVTSANAQTLLRDVFEREGAPSTLGLSGQVPEITGSRLGKAIEKHGQNRFGDTLDFGTRDALAQLQENIGRSELLQKLLKNTGTIGGGSQTAMDLPGQLLAQQAGGGVSGTLFNATIGRAKNLEQAALSDALQNPDIFVRGIEKKLAQGRALTRSEEAVLIAIRGATAGSLPAAFAQ